MAEYIEREAVKRALADSDVVPKYKADNRPVTDKIIDDIPLADVAPVVHGRWIEQEDPCGDPYYTCSACKDDFYIEMTGAVEKDLFLYSYCPACGAKMDGKGEDDGQKD